jgi:DNA-binding HxlR family transcriptional regulator
LKSLEECGIIRRGEDRVKKSRIRYSLTEKGIALLPLMIEMIIWSGTFDEETAASSSFLNQARENKPSLLADLKAQLITEHLE